MVNRLEYKAVGLVIMFLLCWMGYSPIACRGTVVWSDDFNDGNYDGWTISNNTALWNGSYGFANSNWSATNNYLQLDHEETGLITHPSSVAYGTWSFDFKTPETQLGMGTWANIRFISSDHVLWTDDWDDPEHNSILLRFDVWTHEEPYNYTIVLYKHNGDNYTIIDSGKVPAAGWQHFDVTRNTTGWISVYHNGSPIPIMEGEATEITTSELFWVWSEDEQMIDNVVVSDTVDFPPTIDWLTIAIIGASAVVIVAVMVIILKRR